MINFATTPEKSDERWKKAERIGIAATTAILVIYLVVVVGVIGWGLYWSQRQTKVSDQYTQLSAQVAGLSEQEVLVRKLANRLGAIKTFLDTRADVTGNINNATGAGITVTEWVADDTGAVTTTVRAQDVASVKAFVDDMTHKYASVQLVSMGWTPLGNWAGTVSLKGGKK
jgi:hypothetical protein